MLRWPFWIHCYCYISIMRLGWVYNIILSQDFMAAISKFLIFLFYNEKWKLQNSQTQQTFILLVEIGRVSPRISYHYFYEYSNLCIIAPNAVFRSICVDLLWRSGLIGLENVVRICVHHMCFKVSNGKKEINPYIWKPDNLLYYIPNTNLWWILKGMKVITYLENTVDC